MYNLGHPTKCGYYELLFSKKRQLYGDTYVTNAKYDLCMYRQLVTKKELCFIILRHKKM